MFPPKSLSTQKRWALKSKQLTGKHRECIKKKFWQLLTESVRFFFYFSDGDCMNLKGSLVIFLSIFKTFVLLCFALGYNQKLLFTDTNGYHKYKFVSIIVILLHIQHGDVLYTFGGGRRTPNPELSGCITTLTVTTFRGADIKVEVANFCAAMDTLIDQDEDPPPLIRQKRSKKVQFDTLALGQGPQSTKKTPNSKILATGL